MGHTPADAGHKLKIWTRERVNYGNRLRQSIG